MRPPPPLAPSTVSSTYLAAICPPTLLGLDHDGREEGVRAMMISHFINQILFSFLEQRAIPLRLPLPLSPHPPFHTWRRLTLSSHVGSLQWGGGIEVQLPREWAHNPTPPTRFPSGLGSHRARLPGAMFPVARRLVWEWGNNSLKRERGLVFAQCQTRGERQKFMGVGRVRVSRREKSRKWSESLLHWR